MPQSPVDIPASESIAIGIEDVLSLQCKAGVAYWKSLCGNRRFPAREDLTLRGMATILRFSVIVKVIGDGADYEFVYVGDAQRQAFGTYFKGIRVSQIAAAVPYLGALLHGAYGQARSSGIPFAVQGRVDPEPSDSKMQYHETVFLPLGGSDAGVDHLLIVGVYVPQPFWDVSENAMAILTEDMRMDAANRA